MLLLSKPETNFKISKNLKLNYNTYSLNHAHSNLSGFNVCPMANKITENENNSKKSNCSSVCVGYNGFASIHNSVMESRIKKTLSYFLDKKSFLDSLVHEIDLAIKQSEKKNLKPSFRLNAYSDIKLENDMIKDGKNIFQLFPDVDFYDYTKFPSKYRRNLPANYHLTFSRSELTTDDDIQAQLTAGRNVAVVFDQVPTTWQGWRVVDGDKDDLIFLHPQGVIIGLIAKGAAKKDNTGFVVRTRKAGK